MRHLLKSPTEMLELWEQWLRDNPEADISQRYYAAGVVDGLVYACFPEGFNSRWEDLLEIER